MVMMMSVRIALLPLINFLMIHKVVCESDESSEKKDDDDDDDDDDSVHLDSILYAVFAIAVACLVLLLICIVLFIRQRKKAEVSNNRQNKVQDPRRHIYENDSFVNVSPMKTDGGQTLQSTDTETIEYATIHENQQTLQPDSALRSGAVVNSAPLYSVIKPPGS